MRVTKGTLKKCFEELNIDVDKILSVNGYWQTYEVHGSAVNLRGGILLRMREHYFTYIKINMSLEDDKKGFSAFATDFINDFIFNKLEVGKDRKTFVKAWELLPADMNNFVEDLKYEKTQRGKLELVGASFYFPTLKV